MAVASNMASLFRLTRALPKFALRSCHHNPILQLRCISTSKKDKDTTIAVETPTYKTPVTEEQFANPKANENWISYGYDENDKTTDRFAFHFTSFMVISLVFCGSVFIFSYLPDYKMQDWILRESFLQLHYREKNGLDLVSRDYVDPSTIELPTEEELGDARIML